MTDAIEDESEWRFGTNVGIGIGIGIAGGEKGELLGDRRGGIVENLVKP